MIMKQKSKYQLQALENMQLFLAQILVIVHPRVLYAAFLPINSRHVIKFRMNRGYNSERSTKTLLSSS